MSRKNKKKIKFVFNILNYTMVIWKSIKSIVGFAGLHNQRFILSPPGTPASALLRKKIFSRLAMIYRVGEQDKNPFKKRFLRIFSGYPLKIPGYRNPFFPVSYKMNKRIRIHKVLPVNSKYLNINMGKYFLFTGVSDEHVFKFLQI